MAQAERITTAIRELMSRGRPPKSTSPVRAAHTEFVAALAGNAPRPIHSDSRLRRTSKAAPTICKRCSRRCTSISPRSSPKPRRIFRLVSSIAATSTAYSNSFRQTRWGQSAMLRPKCGGTRIGGRHDPPVTTAPVHREACQPPLLHRRLGCPDHHGRRRGRPCPPLAGKAGRGGAARLLGQPHRPARGGHGAHKSALVRENDRSRSSRTSRPGFGIQ